MSRTFDANGRVILEQDFANPSWNFSGLADTAPPSAPAIADFLGVPIRWVLIAGIVLLVLPYFLKRR